jgi:hypothetical protein
VQPQALGGDPIVLHRQSRAERAAGVVEQQRILAAALRKDALAQADDEDEPERPAAQRLGDADEDAAEAMLRRVAIQLRQPWQEHAADFGQRHRADGRHRPQIGEQLEDAGRMAECARRQRGQAIQPLAPRRLRRQRRQFVHERQREAGQVVQRLEVAFHRPRLAAAGLVRCQLAPAEQ